MQSQSTRTSCSRHRWPAAAVAAMLPLVITAADADLTVTERVVTTPRHVFTVDDTGLPAQWEIRALAADIPLAWRAEAKWPEAVVKMVGRGPQLASPVRLEATVDRAVVPAKAEAPAVLTKTDRGVEAAATWQAGTLKGRLRLLYAADGSLTGQLTYNAKGTDLERLDLVLELSGPVDTAIAGNPATALAGKPPLAPGYGTLGSGPGILWSDGATPAGDGDRQKGQVGHFFLGNGDRGCTWLPHAGDGFSLGGKEPTMTVERKREGAVVWKIAIVNKSPRSGERTAGFTLLTHPTRPTLAERRFQQWQPWKEKALTPAIEAAARSAFTENTVLVRAEAGSVYEAAAARVVLEGASGGDALSAAATLADRYPLGLFRYLAAPHTALAAQLRSNGGALATPGGSPAVDNMILGRALLHDIGVDLAGLASRAHAADVAQALETFGYFKNDGQTEFLPYWRAEDIARYGELFEAEAKAGFATTATNPVERVRLSAFIRQEAAAGGSLSRKALLVLVNESTKPVRELLYVENPAYLFGDYTRLNTVSILAQLDYSHIPEASDWRRAATIATLPNLDMSNVKIPLRFKNLKDKNVEAGKVVGCLQDLLTTGYVPTVKMGPGFAVFGPIHVPARGMRLLMGSGAEPAGVLGSVWKVSLDGKRTPVAAAPVHVFAGGDLPVVEKLELLKAKPLATLRTAADGTFRLPLGQGVGKVTVLAEVDGKLYPDRQILTPDGALWPATALAGSVKRALGADHYYWAECVIEALEGNALPALAAGPAKPEPGKPWTAPRTGIEFVWIPAGEFAMGSAESEAGRSPNETLHQVTITKGFWLGKYEITQGQWMRITGNNPAQFKCAGDRAPVENVSLQDCQFFIMGLNALVKGSGVRYRLPTEAEWEYACRAGSKTALYNGALTIKGTLNGPELDEIAWYGGNSGLPGGWGFDTRKWRDRQHESARSGTHPVGQKKPNAWGLYDMLGNVSEWVGDMYTDDLGAAAVTDPFVSPCEDNGRDGLYGVGKPKLKAVGLLRGGSWYRLPSGCRAAYRQKDLAPHGENAPPTDNFDVGLRLVCELE